MQRKVPVKRLTKRPTKTKIINTALEALKAEVGEWNSRLQNFVVTCAQEFGKVWANQQEFATSIEHIDRNVLALAKIVEDLYNYTHPAEATPYDQVVKEAFERVHKELEEEMKKRAEEEDKSEGSEVEEITQEEALQAMSEAGDMTIDENKTGGGTIPEEAEIFGG